MAWNNFYQQQYKVQKYRNRIVEYDGKKFDSAKECQRYYELKLLEKAGEISDLQTQVEFVLIPEQREPDIIGKRGGIKKGKTIEYKCSYFADFVYTDNRTGEKVVEDTKGYRTKEYVIKRKLMLKEFGIKIKEL